MPNRPHTTQYSEYVENMLSRAGHERPGAHTNVHDLAAWMGLKVTPSFRKRIKQCVSKGLLWDVAPSHKINPKMSEYLIPYGTEGGTLW